MPANGIGYITRFDYHSGKFDGKTKTFVFIPAEIPVKIYKEASFLFWKKLR